MQIEITQKKKLKRASGSIREGKIKIQVPQWWPKDAKHSAIKSLAHKLDKHAEKQEKLITHSTSGSRLITLSNQKELASYVEQINAETFNAPIQKIRLGWSKYSQLAQLNIRSKTVTVSKYCLNNVPENALRYLIIHELAHCYEANHSHKFWALVAKYVPDYKHQSKIIKAFHQQAVQQADKEISTVKIIQSELPKPKPGLIQRIGQQLSLFS